MGNTRLQSLKTLLDRWQWPAIYPFKFIVPIDKMSEVMALFEKQDTTTRISRNGNYISVTAHPLMYNPGKVIAKYEEALKIEGIVAL